MEQVAEHRPTRIPNGRVTSLATTVKIEAIVKTATVMRPTLDQKTVGEKTYMKTLSRFICRKPN